MNKFLSSLALAAGLAASAGANATTYDLGGMPWMGVVQTGLYNVNGTFSDTLDFSLNVPFSALHMGVGTFDVNEVELGMGPGVYPYYGINASSLNMAVYNSDNVELASGTAFELADLHKGNYYAVITGTTFGAQGGEYSVLFTIASVPEASTLAMMLAGLGMIGYVAMRRRS